MTATSLLGIEHPIIQGPFGGGLSTAKLAATVSNLGGLGSYGAHIHEPDDIARVAREIRALTSKPFALNLWVSDHDPGGLNPKREDVLRAQAAFEPYFRELGIEPPTSFPSHFHPRFDQQIEALLEARPPVFSFVFGIPSKKILEACRARGIRTIGAATSIAEARALDEAGVDLILATGCEAGGHRPSFLQPSEDSLIGTFALTQLVVDRVRAPVIAAGGIADARGVRAALALGASAAQIGTAFLATQESGTTDAHRAILFDPEQLTTLTRAFTGRLARGVTNRFTRENTSNAAPFPIQSWLVGHLKRAHGTDFVSLWSGQIAPNLRYRNAIDLMNSLIS